MAFWLKVVFCYGLAFSCGAFCYGLLVERLDTPPEDHTRRPPSIRRPPNQKGITDDHTHPGSKHPPPRPAARHAGIPPAMHAGIAPPMNRMTNRCKNITLPQTSFAGGNNPATPRPPLQARSLRETQSITAFA